MDIERIDTKMKSKNMQSKGVYIGITDANKAIVLDSINTAANHNIISIGQLGTGKVLHIDDSINKIRNTKKYLYTYNNGV